MNITAHALDAAPAGTVIRHADGEVVAVKTTDADGTPWHAPSLARAGGDLWHSADSLVREFTVGEYDDLELATPPAPVTAEPATIDLSPLTTAIAWAERDPETAHALLESMTLEAIRELTMEMTTGQELASKAVREALAQESKARHARARVATQLRALIPGDLFDGGTFEMASEHGPVPAFSLDPRSQRGFTGHR